MKYTIIFLILAIFFSQIALFLLQNQSPWNKEKLNKDLSNEQIETNAKTVEYVTKSLELGIIRNYINTENLLILSMFLMLTTICAVACIHSFLDKLFFKRFYQQADWKIAIRRGVMTSLCLFALILLRLIAGLTFYIAIPLIGLFVLIEYLIFQKTRVTQSDIKSEKKSDKEVQPIEKKEFRSDLTTRSFKSILI